jgi:hypothetical protein
MSSKDCGICNYCTGVDKPHTPERSHGHTHSQKTSSDEGRICHEVPDAVVEGRTSPRGDEPKPKLLPRLLHRPLVTGVPASLTMCLVHVLPTLVLHVVRIEQDSTVALTDDDRLKLLDSTLKILYLRRTPEMHKLRLPGDGKRHGKIELCRAALQTPFNATNNKRTPEALGTKEAKLIASQSCCCG